MNLLNDTENAIHTFYQSQNSDERNKSHQWLLQLQKSQEAWQVSWLLLDANKSIECQYYGAVILHYKICNVIEEISERDLQELKKKLMSQISSFGNGIKLVLSKLCSTLAALLIQMVKEDTTLLECFEQINTHLKENGCEPQYITLQIITELSSEFKNVHMDKSKRILARTFLNQFIENLISIWKEILQNDNNSLKMDSLSCMLGWIEFGMSIVDFVPLIPILMEHIKDDDLSSKVCEVLSEIFTAPSSFSLKDTIFEIVAQILQLESLIGKAITDGNEEVINSTCLMISNIGETHSNILVTAKETSHQLISLNLTKLILQFSSIQGHFPVDETCSRLTLTFWYHLQDDLLSLDIDKMSDYHQQFHEAFLMLIDVYFRKAQFPPDEIYRKYNSDEREQFRCYRIDIQDTIMYLHNTLRDRCLIYFIQKLTALFADPTSTWQQYESVMFLLSGINCTIDTEDTTYIPNIIQLLQNVPDHPKTRDTMYIFLGGLGEWLNSNSKYIEELLPFLLSGLTKKETSSSCSLSLQDICQDCALLIEKDSIKKIVSTCREALQLSDFSPKVKVRLFQICGYAISALPPTIMNAELDILVTPLLQQLKVILENNNPTNDVCDQICHRLNCFQALYRSLDPFEELSIHPISLVYQQMIGLFPLLKKFCKNEVVVINATICISKAIEIVREHMAPFVSLTCQILYEFFSILPEGSILDVSSLIICMFGSEEGTLDVVRQFYVALVDSCLRLSENGSNYTDCLQSFMDLLCKVIKTVPELIFHDLDKQMAFIKCSFVLLTFPETPTVKSTCNFLVTYINHVSVYENGKDLLMNIGKDLVYQLFICIGVSSPRHLSDSYAEVLLALNKNFVTQLAVWMSEVLGNENFPTSVPTDSQKEFFRKAVLKQRASKSRMKETVKNFSLLCRGLQGMPHVS